MSARLTFRDAVAAHFRAHPGEWLDGREFFSIGGCYASRSRIAECGTQLGMQIQNRLRRVRSSGVAGGLVLTVTISEYRYVPAEPQQAALWEVA